MTLLSNADIERHRSLGSIVIEPFNPAALNNVSHDLTLGAQIARYRKDQRETFDLATDDPADLFEIEDAYEEPGMRGRGWRIAAGERVLGHSQEIAGGRQIVCPQCQGHGSYAASQSPECCSELDCLTCNGRGRFAVTTQLHATSTAARIGWQVCGCAGFGDVGYVSPWVFELTCMAPRAMWLPVGAVLAQVSFFEVSPVLEGTSYEKIGRYQKLTDPAEIARTWTLAKVLPKRLKVRGSIAGTGA